MRKMENKIYALYNDEFIRIYQAYNDTIANQAIKLQKFGDEFKMNRMTWIKPSFLWMMYRSGWASKEGQNRILAIDIKRIGFNYAVENSTLSSYNSEEYKTKEEWKRAIKHSEIRCQWDPERDIYGNPLDRRSIQLGLRGKAVKKYVNEWIVNITDITLEVKDIKRAILLKEFDYSMIPIEREYFI